MRSPVLLAPPGVNSLERPHSGRGASRYHWLPSEHGTGRVRMGGTKEAAVADAVRAILEELFGACASGDVEHAVSLFAADGVLIDPHYPYPRMQGSDAIRDGLTWGIGGMRSMSFTTEQFFPGPDGVSGAAEVATHHVLKVGKKLDFPQVFVIETVDGQIRRLQAYEPYRPNGVLGAMLKVGHGVHRIRSRRRSVDR